MIENGKRSLWDELVDGQLEKCRPVAFLRRHALDAAPHAVIPGGPIAVNPSEESLRSMDDDDDTAGVQHTLGPATAEEIGLSAAAGPKDDDGVLPPSLCLSEEQLVAEYSSNGAPLGVNKATKVGPSTQIDLVTPATTSGPRETPSGGASSATLAADSAALTADFAALVADSAALVADSSALAAAYAPPVAGVMEEDRAPFPGAHARPIPPSPHHARVGMIQRTVIQRSTVNQYVDDTALLSDICHVVG